jgi:membrane associated rhomboid family serine protease
VIPLRDDVAARRLPLVNLALIALNVVAFLAELEMGEGVARFMHRAAVVPALYTGTDRALGPVDALVTSFDPDLGRRVLLSMFLHGGWAHLLGNMLYLWIFGDNVEDRLGHLRYLIFYLACGWTASYAHIWSQPASSVPAIGASGAIAGVLGAYMTLYPRARVVALVPLGFVAPLLQVRAVVFLGFWFVQQFLLGAFGLAAAGREGAGVAWWAHIGGFAAGFVLVRLIRRPSGRRAPSTWRILRFDTVGRRQ